MRSLAVSLNKPTLALIRSCSEVMEVVAMWLDARWAVILLSQDCKGRHFDDGDMLLFWPQDISSNNTEKEHTSIIFWKKYTIKILKGLIKCVYSKWTYPTFYQVQCFLYKWHIQARLSTYSTHCNINKPFEFFKHLFLGVGWGWGCYP